MKNNILISGGMGYLAQNLIKLLGEKDYFFILLDIIDKRPNNKNIKYIHADISKGENLEKELFYFFKKNKIKIDGVVNTPAWNNFESLEKTKFFEIEKIINTKLIGYANIIKSIQQYLHLLQHI
jgi:short-subunit dehydrogenase